ncbi:hypothetical protein [Paraburkholderia antibiotica]|uniref:Transmembrane protein n=1 Tax=Paraburkholderia antibiotica TaxID=2728839 RepID=A0A7Y0A1M2_9BURK|nr:hypothetical protein [Paraburkholderia antibiotica]NML34841.1 hypothetical protein [Paraburkholderia antibiotica]
MKSGPRRGRRCVEDAGTPRDAPEAWLQRDTILYVYTVFHDGFWIGGGGLLVGVVAVAGVRTTARTWRLTITLPNFGYTFSCLSKTISRLEAESERTTVTPCQSTTQIHQKPQTGMPLETVHLDRVFGVVQTAQNRQPVTLFGFESKTRKEYSVAAPGRPRIESGMTITAYLVQADNWQTLIGWRDHENGEIVCKPVSGPIFACIWSVLGFCMMTPGFSHRSAAMSVIAAIMVVVFGFGIRNVCFLRKVRRELEQSAWDRYSHIASTDNRTR